MNSETVTIDGNEAAAYVAHKTNEVISIYPITPSSGMGEFCDDWSSRGLTNVWGTIPEVIEMQSEGGAAGTVHGSLQTGALTTTFTSSQGLLLMIPNMYKIAGELTSTVFHVAARSVATQALSIFGDHSDVMATRMTGWGMLFANSVQEVMDFALIAQRVALESRIPFLHVFDGFRTSHEVMKISRLTDAEIISMIPSNFIHNHRNRALSPDHPVIRGTAQNPDVYFQARESVNTYYSAAPSIVQNAMSRFAEMTGRSYRLFDYAGHPKAERVIVMMGSGCEAAEETVRHLVDCGEQVGLVKVRLFRPFSPSDLVHTFPKSVRAIAVLDRTKEPGSAGEPLYQDVVTALAELPLIDQDEPIAPPHVIGGRYGLSSKEFTPGMIAGVFDALSKRNPRQHFTVGIKDDITKTSIRYDSGFNVEDDGVIGAVFWGLGADGTVSANKNSIKIIGMETENYAQGYFVYDSKKAGAVTVSHLRFGPRPIKSTYLVQEADFIGVHQFAFINRYPVLSLAKPGAVFLLNSPFSSDESWNQIPFALQKEIIEKRIRFYVIDAYGVAKANGMGGRINTIMQTCFFAISGVLPRNAAIEKIKSAIRKTYGKKGEDVVQQNFAAVDAALEHLVEISVPDEPTGQIKMEESVSSEMPDFVRMVTAEIMAGRGDFLPVSAFPEDGTYPTGTTQWEKRGISLEVPAWETDICIQCGKCVFVCPHSCIRAKAYADDKLADAPGSWRSMSAKWKEMPNRRYTIQVSVDDCTGCRLCVEICPVIDKNDAEKRALNMVDVAPIRDAEKANWAFFCSLPEVDAHSADVKFTSVKNIQLLRPLFEFSGACAGCGETPYLKLLSQLFGDRAIIANATGCSSIYGGNLPTTPWAKNDEGRGPAWSNSLFEDNAEFGLGMRIAVDKQNAYARELVDRFREVLQCDEYNELADRILKADQFTPTGIAEQRDHVARLKEYARVIDDSLAHDLDNVADSLVKRSVWIVGGDGWAYDIGYGGLDHVLASGRNVNLLVLDTEVYSNTGGQASKSTPLGATAKFAVSGKMTAKKDLGKLAMSYGSVYVAMVAMGASDTQTVRAFLEAEAYPGPSIIIAYGHCIAHGLDMSQGLNQQKLAVQSGYWPLYRYNPILRDAGKNPLQLDYNEPKIPIREYLANETRFRILLKDHGENAATLLDTAQENVKTRWRQLKEMSVSTS